MIIRVIPKGLLVRRPVSQKTSKDDLSEGPIVRRTVSQKIGKDD